MRLWHQSLIPLLPIKQLLGQHRECCALRGNGWGKPHATVNYVFSHPPEWLWSYHMLVMWEMLCRGYHPQSKWYFLPYRGNFCPPLKPSTGIDIPLPDMAKIIYSEHDDQYLQECLDNLKQKGVTLRVD